MRLKGVKPSKNFKDDSWANLGDDYLVNYLDGSYFTEPQPIPLPHNDSYINNPYADMTPDEISMVKSGASHQDVMFLRALRNSKMRFSK